MFTKHSFYYRAVVDIVQQLNTFDYYRDFPTTIPNSLTHRGIDSQYDSFMQSLPIRQPEDGHLATGICNVYYIILWYITTILLFSMESERSGVNNADKNPYLNQVTRIFSCLNHVTTLITAV